MTRISILDTKSANFHSVKKAVDLYEKDNIITSSKEEILRSEALIIPGVSSTDTVLNNIYNAKLEKIILEFSVIHNISSQKYKLIYYLHYSYFQIFLLFYIL